MDVSNKPLDKIGIIKRLTAFGLSFDKKPACIREDDKLKTKLCDIKIKNGTEEEILQLLEKDAKGDLLNALCYTVHTAEKLNVETPLLKKTLGLLLLDNCAFTALELVNPDMCDLAQVYFKEIGDQQLWVKAHARVQQGFPQVFEEGKKLRDHHTKLMDWIKKYEGRDLEKPAQAQLNKMIIEYLNLVIELMDQFSMLDPMYVTRQVDIFFRQKLEAVKQYYTPELKGTLLAFADDTSSFETLRERVEEL